MASFLLAKMNSVVRQGPATTTTQTWAFPTSIISTPYVASIVSNTIPREARRYNDNYTSCSLLAAFFLVVPHDRPSFHLPAMGAYPLYIASSLLPPSSSLPSPSP